MASTTTTTTTSTQSSTSTGPVDWKVVEYQTHVPTLDEIANLFKQSLGDHYNEATVEIVDCPDLSQAPFYLAGKGLNGSPAIADVGGVPYLVPLAQTDKEPYSLAAITEKINYQTAFYIGASAGPFHLVGTNSELMPNCSVSRKDEQQDQQPEGEHETPQSPSSSSTSSSSSSPSGAKEVKKFVVSSETHCTKLDESSDGKGYTTYKLPSDCDQFCILGNLFLSNGKPGKVIKVKVAGRKGTSPSNNNFISNLRGILSNKYNQQTGQQVSLGGVFLINRGKVKVHVMPNFSSKPLCTDEDVNNWLKYFEVSAPLVALTTFHSYDPGQDLRIEHTHCFSKHGDGGHYHYDTTADTIEYEGYFNVANKIYRIDPPTETHNIGRD